MHRPIGTLRPYNQKKDKKKIVLRTLLILAILAIVGFGVYVSIYYEADEIAQAAYQQGLDDGTITTQGNMTIITPERPTDTGIIFYPGAKVEAIAYIPLLQQLADEGFTVVLIEMPFNMAIFDSNAAKDVFKVAELQDISSWYMMGHSMGGGMASNYASKNQDKVDGLLLIGAYVYGDYPTEKALTIYGTFNDNLEEKIDYTDNIVIIEGGNHAQYGNYGEQKGDPTATISDVEQQSITVDAIVDFLSK
ncbi:MAG: carboxymethylenebutenolidase [Epulopiscium sp. Nele67-Bin004]|nr:MAG: carboxymethylenebutenolidase [Epulopiscium sp. Nele67-Bin004]